MPTLQLDLDAAGTIANETMRRDVEDTLVEKDVHPFCLILHSKRIAKFIGICAVEKFGGGMDECDGRLGVEMGNFADELCEEREAQIT